MNKSELKSFLDKQVEKYHNSEFIKNDPIQIPHLFDKKQDIEIIGFWIAMLSWGRRTTIINKGKHLVELMDHAPHDFIMNHTDKDLQRIEIFVHRTFQPIDTLYFISFLKHHYTHYKSLEDAFNLNNPGDVKDRLINFHNYFFSLDYAPKRTRKHVSTPNNKSTCKRLNMFLRWMVRSDEKGVDFGLWDTIDESDLMIPLDVHVNRIARELDLLHRKVQDWKAVEALTASLRKLDKSDPVKYDYALFSLGVNNAM